MVNASDGVLMKTVIGLFSNQCVRTTVFRAWPYLTKADVDWATADWGDWWHEQC